MRNVNSCWHLSIYVDSGLWLSVMQVIEQYDIQYIDAETLKLNSDEEMQTQQKAIQPIQ